MTQAHPEGQAGGSCAVAVMLHGAMALPALLGLGKALLRSVPVRATSQGQVVSPTGTVPAAGTLTPLNAGACAPFMGVTAAGSGG